MMLVLGAAQLRLSHVFKNLLVFVPVVTSHRFLEVGAWLAAFAAAISFALIATAGYQLNDVLDKASDAAHEAKRHRPYAAGNINTGTVLTTAIVLAAAGVALAALAVPPAIPHLLFYVVLATAYSAILKRIAAIDVVVLSLFYVLRIAVGAAAIEVELSGWLLSFSFFLFMSLALMKRYCDIPGQQRAAAWTYDERDQPILIATSIGTGMAALVLYSLYVQAEAVRLQNSAPYVLWAGAPILFLLLFQMWRSAKAGGSDGNIYSRLLTQPLNWALGSGLIAIFILAAVGGS